MINKDHNYTAYSPKQTKTGKVMFSISNFDKKNPNFKSYITVFCNNDVEIYDRQKITITEITGVNTSEYNGKLQVSMFANVEPNHEDIKASVPNHVDSVNISDSDLPF